MPDFLPILQLEFDWSQLLTPFSNAWWRETVCSMLVGVSLGVLGCFVVLRRMALIGDALSHSILPGVVIAFMLYGMVFPNAEEVTVASLLLGALIAGLLTAVLINVVSRFSRTKEDSAIGIVFTAFFALGIILISALPTGTHFDLKCFLFGEPLAVQRSDLILMAIVSPIVLLTILLLFNPLKVSSFDPVVAAAMGLPVGLLHYLIMGLLSATVVAGLKTTGVVLVVAMVITPASAAYQLCNRFWTMLVLAGGFGAVSAAAGMSLAFASNSPTGPAMVLVAAAIFILTMLFSPSHGVVFDRIRRVRMRRHFRTEDVLRGIYKLNERGQESTVSALAQLIHLSESSASRIAERLASAGFVTRTADQLELTARGVQRAEELVRAHRLWESYLADRHFDPDTIHNEAERLEHAHELSEELDVQLGHPERDPHGEPIPRQPPLR